MHHPFRPRSGRVGPATLLALSMAIGLAACGGGDGHRSSKQGDTAPAVQAHAVYSGTTAPPATTGAVGDFYLNYAAGQLFGPKTADGWPATPITLATTTANGEKSSLRSGFGAPSDATGVDGDFYLDLSSGEVSGPKAAGAWPATGVVLVGPVGAQGPAGATGTAGPAGPTGPAGPAGPTGETGATGATGVSGKSLLSGAGNPNNAIGADGDFYLQTTSTTLFGPKAAGAWPSTGTSLVGPAGQDGDTGPAGVDGRNGNGILTGAGAPSSIVGAAGDLYLDLSSSTLYGPKTAAGWPNAGVVLVGPAGADGASGKSLLNGTGVPNAALGVDGDFYLDTSSSTLYGPKSAGTWPGGVSLVGADGSPGADGTNGTNGTNGTDGTSVLSGSGVPGNGTGSVGDLYLDTSTTTLYGPKTALGWPPSGVGLKGAAGPIVFVSRFVVPANEGVFYVPVSGARDVALTGNYTSNATSMPVACRFTTMYVNSTWLSGNTDDTLTITLHADEVPTSITTSLTIDSLSPTLSGGVLAAAVDVFEGATVALKVEHDNPGAVVEVNVSLACQ